MSIFSLAEDTSLITTSPHILPSIRSAIQCRFVTWILFSENILLLKKWSAVLYKYHFVSIAITTYATNSLQLFGITRNSNSHILMR